MATSISPRSASVHPTRQQLDELDALLQRMLDLPVNQVDESGAEEEPEPAKPQFRQAVSYKVPIGDTPPSLEPRVVPAEFAPTPPPPAPPPAPPPVVQAPKTVIQPSAPPGREPGPDDWVRLASTWQPSAQTWQPLAQSWQQAARTPPTPPPPAVAPIPPQVAPTQEPLSQPPSQPAVRFAPLTAPAPKPEPPSLPRQAEAPVEPAIADLVFPPLPTRPMPKPEEERAEPPVEDAVPGYDWWQWPFVAVNWVFDILTIPLGPLGAGLRTRIGRNILAVLGLACVGVAAALVAADYIGWIW